MKEHRAGSRWVWFGLGLAIGALVASRRVASDQPRQVKQVGDWERALAERYGVQKAVLLVAKVQACDAVLYPGRPRFETAALRDHLSLLYPG